MERTIEDVPLALKKIELELMFQDFAVRDDQFFLDRNNNGVVSDLYQNLVEDMSILSEAKKHVLLERLGEDSILALTNVASHLNNMVEKYGLHMKNEIYMRDHSWLEFKKLSEEAMVCLALCR